MSVHAQKNAFETDEIDYISLSRVGASCRVSSLFAVPRARTMVKFPIASAHTHKRASTHNTMVKLRTKEISDRLEQTCARVQLLKMRARTFLHSYIPEIVRNVLSTYRYYICASSAYACIYVYIRICIIMYNEKNYKRQYSTQ